MKVSVIIPVYNAEKYLPVCLESLAIQTLRDFEVIIVDDCSTDSSLAVAESFVERFDGRLKIFTLSANTGSGAVPRNVGLEYACGEYVFFMDNDDLLVDNALEVMYGAAAEYRADVVSMDAGFQCDEEPVPKNFTFKPWSKIDSDEPVLDVKDFDGRLKKFYVSQFEWVPWSKLVRRQFLIDNDIKFPATKISDDVVWMLEMIFSAERWLRVDVPLYVQRVAPESLTRQDRSPEQDIVFHMSPLVGGVEALDEFMREKKFFKENPSRRLELLNFFVRSRLHKMSDAAKKISPLEAYEIFLREFSKAGNVHSALVAYLMMTTLFRNEPTK